MSKQQLLELPANQTPTQLHTLLNDRIRDLDLILQKLVSNPADEDLDMANFLIHQLADPVADLDAVNLRTLKRFGNQQPPPIVTPPFQAGAGAATFTVPGRNYGVLQIEAVCTASGPVQFNAPSIDETDSGWYGTATMDGSTNPAVISPAINGVSRYGRKFAAGDLIIWINFAKVGAGATLTYAVEIDEITSIDTFGNMTVSRGLFGTPIAAQPNKAFYRLIDKTWSVTLTAGKPRQVIELPWANKCVAAVVSGGREINLIPDPMTGFDLNIPGFRTLNGAEYIIGAGGAISAGTVADFRIPTASWHSFRNIFARLATPGGRVEIAVVYLDQTGSVAALAGTVVFEPGDQYSFINRPPQDHRTPAVGTGWPFNILATMEGALDANGKLQLGFSVNPNRPVVMGEDGWLDFIVTQGSASDLILAVQT